MRSAALLAPMRLCLRLLPLLLVPGCAAGPPIVTTPIACTSLVPKHWRDPVPGVPLPATDTAGDWAAAFDGQTGQLDKANDRTVATIEIVETCERRDAAAVRRARGLFDRIFGR